MPNLLNFTGRAKAWARGIKRDVQTLAYVFRDPECPLLPKLVAGLVAAYALSPIDLIPDFIPVLGYLDDLLLVPLGILLAIRLTPRSVLERARDLAESREALGTSKLGFVLVLALWCVAAALAWWLISKRFR